MSLLIKIREEFVLDPEYYAWEWKKVEIDKDGLVPATKYKDISSRTASRIIKNEDLVCVEKDIGMEIWDTADRAFQREWKGNIKVEDL